MPAGVARERFESRLSLDELTRAMKGARNNLVDLETLSEEELESIAAEFKALHEHACASVKSRAARTGPAADAEIEAVCE